MTTPTTPPEPLTFGHVVRQARLDAGLTAGTVSLRLGEDISYVDGWENGTASPCAFDVKALADLFPKYADALWVSFGRVSPDVEAAIKALSSENMLKLREWLKARGALS